MSVPNQDPPVPSKDAPTPTGTGPSGRDPSTWELQTALIRNRPTLIYLYSPDADFADYEPGDPVGVCYEGRRLRVLNAKRADEGRYLVIRVRSRDMGDCPIEGSKDRPPKTGGLTIQVKSMEPKEVEGITMLDEDAEPTDADEVEGDEE